VPLNATQTIKKQISIKHRISLKPEDTANAVIKPAAATGGGGLDTTTQRVTRNKKLGASSEELSEIDDLGSYGEDMSNGRSVAGISNCNPPIINSSES
jgi:hypothetical protein